MSPVPVENVELGVVAGRSPNDEAAAIVMTVLLLMAITTYGNLVLTGVVEEKASRVVEVLLARMPARTLLAGKVAGIGLLGFAQFAVTGVAALVATMVVDAVDVPAVRGGVLAWVVGWFVLGYALYAMVYGALGSLASRTEDAQSVAGPVIYVLLGGLLGLVPCRQRGSRQRLVPAALAVPGDRAVRHARPHRPGHGRMVGAAARRRPRPGRDRRPDACSPDGCTPPASCTPGRR